MTESSGPGGGCDSRDACLDTIFHVLADEDRRAVVRYFASHDACSASVDDLIEYILDRDDGDPSREELKRRLHHFTLPKLVEHGVIEYDRRSRTIRYRGPDVYAEILGLVAEADLYAE